MTQVTSRFNVLIIDDHPLITAAYKSAFALLEKEEDFFFDIVVSHNSDDANKTINQIIDKKESLDIVFLDISLPPSQDGKILSGEDLGNIIKKSFADVKIIVSTSHNDNHRIHSILKNLNPEGLLIKNDINPQELLRSIKEVILEPPYYSKMVLKMLRKEISNDFVLDEIDRKILYEISIGTLLKNMPESIPLSVAAIKKRKNQLKEIFGITKPDDKELILIAKEKGFI